MSNSLEADLELYGKDKEPIGHGTSQLRLDITADGKVRIVCEISYKVEGVGALHGGILWAGKYPVRFRLAEPVRLFERDLVKMTVWIDVKPFDEEYISTVTLD